MFQSIGDSEGRSHLVPYNAGEHNEAVKYTAGIQGAFIGFDSMVVNPMRLTTAKDKKADVIEVTTQLKNYGFTTATAITLSFDCDQLPYPSEGPDESKFINGKQSQDVGYVAAGQPTVFEACKRPATFFYWDPTITKRAMCFWGWMVYRDTLDRSIPHLTEWCKYVASRQPISLTEVRYGFANRGRHNCIDTDCADYNSIVRIVH